MALIDLFGSVEEELIHHQIGHGLHEIETMHSRNHQGFDLRFTVSPMRIVVFEQITGVQLAFHSSSAVYQSGSRAVETRLFRIPKANLDCKEPTFSGLT